ncbi:MAG: aldo/keto reductase [Ruminococcus sp.]|nr:aldo/keto reductase [Ruminococcus sp.]
MTSHKLTLTNGVVMPSVGFGTYKSKNGEEAYNAVREAIRCGYRLIDTAEFYGNEESIGKAVKESGVARREILITSKVWNTNRGYDNTMRAFERSLKTLDTDYMDLYLIHWPANALQYSEPHKVNLDTYKALISLYEQGLVKAIGVSNFKPHHLEPLMYTNVKPMVNQIEFHPGFMQNETVAFCKDNDILVEAWSPMARGEIFSHPTIKTLSEKYRCTPAQLCVRWCLQHSVLPLPKSVTAERIRSNKDVFFFEISEQDMKLIDAMPFCGGSGHDSDKVEF